MFFFNSQIEAQRLLTIFIKVVGNNSLLTTHFVILLISMGIFFCMQLIYKKYLIKINLHILSISNKDISYFFNF